MKKNDSGMKMDSEDSIIININETWELKLVTTAGNSQRKQMCGMFTISAKVETSIAKKVYKTVIRSAVTYDSET